MPPRRPSGKGRRSRGQALVIVALVSMLLLAFAGLAIDTGFGYVTQREEQTAADAASLDASMLLNSTTPVPAAAFARAQQIAVANGYSTSPAACSSGTTGAQTVYVYVDSGCAGGNPTGFTTEVVVKVPPDAGMVDPNGKCGSTTSAQRYSCVEVDIVHLVPTTLEHLFGYRTLTVRVTSVAYNGHAIPIPPPSAGPLYTPPVNCSSTADGGGYAIGVDTVGATWNGNPPQPHWVTPNATQASAGAPWVWTFNYTDEWPLSGYTLGIYNGASASSGHYFSQGIWTNQSNTTPPPSNAPGPDGARPATPVPSQDVGTYPAGAAKGTFYIKTSTGANSSATSDWTAQFADGTTMRVSGNWIWGPGSILGVSGGGPFNATITFTMPASLVPAGATPGFSAFVQDGDQCGDTALYETQTPPTPPPPTSGPIVLDS